MEKLGARMVENAYSNYSNGKEKYPIPGYEILDKSPTMMVYENQRIKTIVYAIRGMKVDCPTDVKAVGNIITSTFKDSKRYIDDKALVEKHQPSGYKRIGVGHSLGGAVIDQLLQDGLIDGGISFNPVVEIIYLKNSLNKRIYRKTDPLYELIGRYASNVKTVSVLPIDELTSENALFKLVRYYYAHKMEQFVEDDEPKEQPNSYIIQSVVLNKEKFPTLEKAREWASLHKYKIDKHDETMNSWRFRQVSPTIFSTGHYTAKTVQLQDVGSLIIAYKS